MNYFSYVTRISQISRNYLSNHTPATGFGCCSVPLLQTAIFWNVQSLTNKVAFREVFLTQILEILMLLCKLHGRNSLSGV